MAAGDGHSDLYQQLVIDASLTLSDFFELKRPLLLSASDDEKEAAFSELVELTCRFPNDFLSDQQVGLLLDFFLGAFESSTVTAPYAVRGIHHLVLNSKNLPSGLETPLVQIMFRDGNVQGWDLEKRLLQYNIMEWLLVHRLKEMSVRDSDFVLTFIRAVGGERHPRCLPQVFRMFVIVARSFPIGPLVEDLFEVVACYFPVEFKQSSGDAAITQELLAQGCSRCLTAHPDFAPFCYMLIEEKFTDDDCSLEQKFDVCMLLADAASVFPPEDLVDHLEPILGGLRVVGLNPKVAMPDCVLKSLASVTKAISKCSRDAAVKLGVQLVENLEPFVLQAEMGLTERALSLLHCASSEGPAIRSMIFDRVIPWLLMLVQGDVVNVRANRLEIVQEGLRLLTDWTSDIHESECDDVLLRFEDSLFESLQAARECAPNEALSALYECSAVYLRIASLPSDALLRIQDIVRSSWSVMKVAAVQTAFVHLVGALSETNWTYVRDLISKNDGLGRGDAFPLLCASVHDAASYDAVRHDVVATLSSSPSRRLFDAYLQMANKVSTASPSLLPQVVDDFHSAAFKMISPATDVAEAFAETMQSLGLLLDEESRASLSHKVADFVHSADLLQLFNLFLLQSQDASILRSLVTSLPCEERYLRRLCTGIANHEQDLGRIMSLKSEVRADISCALAKGLLLRGNDKGLAIFEELLERLCKADPGDRELLCDQLNELFDFDSPASDPARCLFRTTFLWRQRIFNQLSNSYVAAVNKADEAGKGVAMRLLPSLLKSSSQHPALQQQLNEFLPVFLVALSTEKHVDFAVLSALPRFISAVSEEKIGAVDGLAIVDALTRTISAETTPMAVVLDCLESLEVIARRLQHCISGKTVVMVAGATTNALGHTKRVVRQKAAAVRNTWESKSIR